MLICIKFKNRRNINTFLLDFTSSHNICTIKITLKNFPRGYNPYTV